MLCGGSIGLQADTVTPASERSIALQGNTVPQVRGNAPQIPCFTMPLEFPAPPSLQPLQGASALASADRFAGGQHAARIPCFSLAIARYRCGLRLVWHENPSLLFVPPRMKHYTRTLMVGACTTSQSRGRYKQIRSHSQSPDGLLLATPAVKP